jgi:hypothetical protein
VKDATQYLANAIKPTAQDYIFTHQLTCNEHRKIYPMEQVINENNSGKADVKTICELSGL